MAPVLSMAVMVSFLSLALGNVQADVEKTFAAFIQLHGRAYGSESEEYSTRLSHFKARLAAVEAHNARTDRSWGAAVNALADRAPAELAMLRGYRPAEKKAGRASVLGLASTSVHRVDASTLPESFTWKGHLAAMEDVQDQGACGSCWAISATAMLRAHSELYQTDRTFSTQQIVECTPNPRQCGGEGGCKGATADLAMEYVVKAGLLTEEAHAYQARDGQCTAQAAPAESPEKNLRSILRHVASLGQVTGNNEGALTGGAAFGMTGWQKVPENLVEPLLLAVYEKGPAVVSVAATDEWSMYSSGIMKACDKGAVINHAVVLVGFGKEGDNLYWQIQNSWGKSWGEGGFIRLQRRENHAETAYCGWDMKPEEGTGCKGGPSRQWVCGSCGILFDSVVPTFALSKAGFLARHSRNASGIFAELDASTTKNLRH